MFAYKPGDNTAAHVREATAIRDALSKRILSQGNLVDPFPYKPGFSTDTYGQHLVDRTLARHPDLLILALHATPPGSSQNVIVASNIGRIGKKADEDDLRVIQTGAPNLEVNASGKRYEVALPLLDASGARIGVFGQVFAYGPGVDKAALYRRAVEDPGRSFADRSSPPRSCSGASPDPLRPILRLVPARRPQAQSTIGPSSNRPSTRWRPSMRARLATLLSGALLAIHDAPFERRDRPTARRSAPSPIQALQLIGRTELPGYSGDFDHFTADVKGNRLFLAAEDHGTLEVLQAVRPARTSRPSPGSRPRTASSTSPRRTD